MVALTCLSLAGVFLFWRIDNPRAERLRAQVIDRIVPRFEWVMAPATTTIRLVQDFRSYRQIAEQNRELRRELRKMQTWKEAALQLEQENARLIKLNDVKLSPGITYTTGKVLADSGSPFRHSVLLNVGSADGVRDGWAAVDEVGLAGRISGLGENTSRVILLTDTASSVPALIEPSGQKALINGGAAHALAIGFLEQPKMVRPGDRVVSSGDGQTFPSGLLVGHVASDNNGRLWVRQAADFERLEFLRVLRYQPTPRISGPGKVIGSRSPEFPALRDGTAELANP